MHKDGFRSADAHKKITALVNITPSLSTLEKWFNPSGNKNNFTVPNFNLCKFISGNSTSFELTEATTNALILYEYSKQPRPSAEEASNRINKLFGDDTVDELQVEVSIIYLNLINFRLSMKVNRPPKPIKVISIVCCLLK